MMLNNACVENIMFTCWQQKARKWNLKLISWNKVINCYIIMTELIDGHETLFKEEHFKESDRNLISDIRSH